MFIFVYFCSKYLKTELKKIIKLVTVNLIFFYITDPHGFVCRELRTNYIIFLNLDYKFKAIEQLYIYLLFLYVSLISCTVKDTIYVYDLR